VQIPPYVVVKDILELDLRFWVGTLHGLDLGRCDMTNPLTAQNRSGLLPQERGLVDEFLYSRYGQFLLGIDGKMKDKLMKDRYSFLKSSKVDLDKELVPFKWLVGPLRYRERLLTTFPSPSPSIFSDLSFLKLLSFSSLG